MRKIYRFLVCFLTLAALMACSKKPTFTVEGTIEGAQDSLLYLHHMALSGPTVVDSVRLGHDGAFSFSVDAPATPEFYVLRIAGQIINFSIDSTETISITARYPGMAANYAVSGSDNCERIRQLALKQQELQRKAMALEQQLGRQAFADSLGRLIEAYKRDVAANYIYSGPDKSSSYFALFQTLGQMPIFNPHGSKDDMRAFAAVATSWDTYHPGSERGQNLHNIAIEGMKNQRIMASKQASLDGVEVVDLGVIEIALPDKSGIERRLSDLKGQVVLLDFHMYSMAESAQRILLLRELYNKYHSQGLEIYQVSFDENEHFWKQMTAQLPWICVRDAEGQTAVDYNVMQVPEFFTISRAGVLQKRSVQMKDLEAEIKSLL